MSDELTVFPMPIGNYVHHPPLDVDAEVVRVIKLFAAFGGRDVPWTVAMPDRGGDAVAERLRCWSEAQKSNTVLYWVGHGWSDTRSASLAHARSPETVAEEGVTPAALAHRIVEREGSGDNGWAIVIVDACRSARFIELLNAAVDDYQGPRRLLLVGVSGEGATTLGRFTGTLHAVLRDTFRADPEIELWRLWPELKRNLPGSEVIPKNIEWDVLRRRVAPVARAITLDVVSELEAIMAELSEDEQRHFVPKAQGAELGELAWYFEGRHTESTQIADWLRDRDSGLLVVTGDAGSGKSALLGHLVVQSHPQLRDLLDQHGLIAERPADERPIDEVFDSVLHLTGLGPADVIRRLAVDLAVGQLPVEADLRVQADKLCAALGDRRRTILVDALDEAVSPLAVVRLILRRLAAIPGVRIIVGTRRSTRESPDQPHPDNQDLLDELGPIDTTVVVDRDDTAITRYITRRLATAVDRGRLHAEHSTIQAAASAIGHAGRHFLFARLAVHEILARPDLLTGAGLADLVIGDHRRLFATAVARLSTDQPVNGPLLQALAYSRGRGLPICDGIWSAAASALSSGDEITDADASELLKAAAPYVMLDREYDQTVYRLAHRTFAEHFTIEPDVAGEMRPDDRRQHRTIALRLIAEADANPATDLNPYLTHYLSAHAGAAGEDAWQMLAQHPGMLDRLGSLAVGADAMRTAFGRFPLPPEIAGVVGARHLLSHAASCDRPGLRQLSMARHAGVRLPGARGGWNAATWTVRWANLVSQPTHLTLTGHTGPVRAVCAIPVPGERTLLATASDDATVRLWDPLTATPVGEPLTGHTGGVVAMCAVPRRGERTLLATASKDGTVRIWDPATSTPAGYPLRGHTGAVVAMCAVPGTETHHPLLATASNDRTVRLWDPATNTAVGYPLAGHTGAVVAMCAVPGPGRRTLLAITSDDGAVRLWNPTNATLVGQPLTGYTGHVKAVCAVPWLGGDVMLAITGPNRTVWLRHLAIHRWFGRRAALRLTGQTSGVRAMCAVPRPDGPTLVATTSDDATVRLWNPTTATLVRQPLRGHKGEVWAVCAVTGPGGRTLLATAGQDQTARLWDPDTTTLGDQPLRGHPGEVWAVCAVTGPGGRTLLATASQDQTAQLWDPDSGAHVGKPLSGHTDWVWAVCAVPNSGGHDLLATASWDGTVRVWDPATGSPVGRPLNGHTSEVRAVCAIPGPDGRTLLATAGNDRTVRVWDPATGTPVDEPMTGHTSGVEAVCAIPGPGGRTLLATAGKDRTIRLWDPTTGIPVGEPLGGHTDWVRAMCAIPGPGGRTLLATAGKDRTIRVWDPTTGIIGVLQVGTKVNALSALPDGSLAIATSEGLAVLVVQLRQ